MKLTILICTYNRCDLLMKCIDSIHKATKPNDAEISLIVIANACTDNTINALTEYTKKHKCINLLIEVELNPGKSYALNHGIKLIQSGYICFIDDDQVIDSNYFLEVYKAIQNHPDASILCGRLLPHWQGDEPNWLHEQGQYRIYPFPVPVFDLGNISVQINPNNELPPGGNVVINRTVFDEIGLFSLSLGPTGHNLVGSEDTDLFIRALQEGKIIQYEPSIVQYHYIDKSRLTLFYLIAKCFQRNRSITARRLNKNSKVPLYLFRQLFESLFHSVLSFKMNKLRFYLMRFSSTLGEISAYISK